MSNPSDGYNLASYYTRKLVEVRYTLANSRQLFAYHVKSRSPQFGTINRPPWASEQSRKPRLNSEFDIHKHEDDQVRWVLVIHPHVIMPVA